MAQPWLARLPFVAHIIVWVELVAWHRASTYNVLDWVAVILLDACLAILMIDLMARWNARPFYSTLLAGGFFGVFHGTFITLGAQANLPLSLILFGTAMPTLMFVMAFYSFLYLWTTQLQNTWLWGGAVLLGVLHGLWVRWLPETDSVALAVPDVGAFLPYTVIALFALILLLYFVSLPPKIQREDWLLSPTLAAFVLAPIMGLVVLRADAGYLSLVEGGVVGVVLVILLSLMWFQHRIEVPPRPFAINIQANTRRVVLWIIALLIFSAMAWLSFSLPGEGQDTLQSNILFAVLLFGGIAWPPLISFFISTQAFIEMGRQEY